MNPIAFKRLFKNNSGYKDYKTLPYMHSLALTLQEFLYTDKAVPKEGDYDYDKNFDFYMPNHINLYDLMTLVAHFISVSWSDFGKSDLNKYLRSFASERDLRKCFGEGDELRYTDGGRGLCVPDASGELTIAVLWGAYIYTKFLFWNPELKRVKRAASLLYDKMREELPLKKECFENTRIMKNTEDAIDYLEACVEEEREETQQPTPSQCCTSPSAAPSAQQTGDEQLKKEHEQLKAELECVKAEKKALEQKVEELSQPLQDLTAKQKVRMELARRLLQKAGMTDEVLNRQGNKQKAARVMSCLLDIKNNNSHNNPAQTCATFLSAPDLSTTRHQKTIAELNPLLEDLGIDIQL